MKQLLAQTQGGKEERETWYIKKKAFAVIACGNNSCEGQDSLCSVSKFAFGCSRRFNKQQDLGRLY